MIARHVLLDAIDTQLQPSRIKDYTLNGLQVEGRERIGRILTGVTACQALLDEAVAWQADAVLVHHGYFWKNEPVEVTGMKRRRLATLLAHDLNLFAYHLPLDVHADLGNNACLGQVLGFVAEGCADGELGQGLVWWGTPDAEMDSAGLGRRIHERLQREPLIIEGHDRVIRRVAWCTGGAQDMLMTAWQAGADAFVSGEISERTTHMARELGVTYVAAGHHATERYGIRALGEWLAERFGIEHRFVDIDNPA
ncbi:Nif3-like dinuclear metal center hexameric protein [Halomonas shantousis]